MMVDNLLERRSMNLLDKDSGTTWRSAKGGQAMSQNSFLTAVLLVALGTIFFWRQLVKLVAGIAVIALSLGLYHLAQIVHL
jgi:hypothetical protein